MTMATAEPLFDRADWWDEGARAFASLRSVTTFRLELLRQWMPQGFAGRFDWPSALIASGAALALFKFKRGVIETIFGCALVGLAAHLLL